MAPRFIYALVSRKSTPLAEYSSFDSSSFRNMAQRVISTVDNTSSFYTKDEGDYCVYAIRKDNDLIFLCITASQVAATQKDSFIRKLHEKWISKYGPNADNMGPNSKNGEFGQTEIQKLINEFNSDTNTQLKEAAENLRKARDKNQENLQLALIRGEVLFQLEERASAAELEATQFKRHAKQVKYHMLWQKYRFYVLIGGIILLVVFVIIVIACGGFTFKRC